jgi:two-component system OmpR family response regulator
MNKPRILVVDDEVGMRELLTDVLRLEGYETTVAPDGLEAWALTRKNSFDLMIIDINMPKMDGFELLRKIREDGSDVPALMLSARNDKTDVTNGLRLGADDYVTKPFGIEELALRIEAILRRTLRVEESNVIRCGPISIDDDKHLVAFEEETIDLSPTEYKLLKFMMERKNRVISKDVLLENIWDIDFENNSTVVDTYISYLRKKLHRSDFEGIKTVRGVGFQIVEPK